MRSILILILVAFIGCHSAPKNFSTKTVESSEKVWADKVCPGLASAIKKNWRKHNSKNCYWFDESLMEYLKSVDFHKCVVNLTIDQIESLFGPFSVSEKETEPYSEGMKRKYAKYRANKIDRCGSPTYEIHFYFDPETRMVLEPAFFSNM